MWRNLSDNKRNMVMWKIKEILIHTFSSSCLSSGHSTKPLNPWFWHHATHSEIVFFDEWLTLGAIRKKSITPWWRWKIKKFQRPFTSINSFEPQVPFSDILGYSRIFSDILGYSRKPHQQAPKFSFSDILGYSRIFSDILAVGACSWPAKFVLRIEVWY